MDNSQQIALIVGAGDGLSASLARSFAQAGIKVGLAARNARKLAPLCDELSAESFSCDASQIDEVQQLFEAVDTRLGSPNIVVYNPSFSVQDKTQECIEMRSFWWIREWNAPYPQAGFPKVGGEGVR